MDNLDAILESLPSEMDLPHGHVGLTRESAKVIAAMIRLSMSNQGCSIGLNAHQMAALKATPAQTIESMNDMVKERKKLLNAVGAATIAVLAWLGNVLFQEIDWHRIFKGN